MRLDAGVTYESFWRRMLAGLVDLILAAILVVTLLLLGLALDKSPPETSALVAGFDGLARHGAWLLAMAVSAQALFWTFLSATPGMLLMGCQVVNGKSGGRLTLAGSLVRVVGLWLGLIPLGIGVLWILRDPRNQGLHDKLAGSVVVKEDESLMTLDELLRGLQ